MRKQTSRAPKPRAIAYCQLESCLQPIDPKKLVKSPRLRFCSKEHDIEWRKQHGFYQAMGAIGNQAQAQTKAETGKIPKYEKRARAVIASNRAHPRRKKRGNT